MCGVAPDSHVECTCRRVGGALFERGHDGYCMFRRLPDAKTSHIRWSRLRLVYQTPIFASWCVCGGSRKIGIRLVTTAHLYFATRDELLKLLGTMQQTWWVASGRSLSRKGRWSGGLAAHVGLVRQLEARGCAADFPESYRSDYEVLLDCIYCSLLPLLAATCLLL